MPLPLRALPLQHRWPQCLYSPPGLPHRLLRHPRAKSTSPLQRHPSRLLQRHRLMCLPLSRRPRPWLRTHGAPLQVSRATALPHRLLQPRPLLLQPPASLPQPSPIQPLQRQPLGRARPLPQRALLHRHRVSGLQPPKRPPQSPQPLLALRHLSQSPKPLMPGPPSSRAEVRMTAAGPSGRLPLTGMRASMAPMRSHMRQSQ